LSLASTTVQGARVVPDRPMFGADFYLEIAGKAGRVIGSLSHVYQWSISGWRDTGQSPNAATDYNQLEAQVMLSAIGGLLPSVTPETFIITTDWRGNYDDTGIPYAHRGPTATRIFADEESVAPLFVMRGWENVPVLRINLENRQVKLNSAPVDLTPIEFKLLSTFIRNEDKVLTHRFLLSQVWGPAYEEERQYLKLYVWYLRQKIEEDPSKPRHLLTVHGVGYKFVP